MRDRHGDTTDTDAMLADLSAETIGALLLPVVAKGAILVTDGNMARRSPLQPTSLRSHWRPPNLRQEGAQWRLKRVAAPSQPGDVTWMAMAE